MTDRPSSPEILREWARVPIPVEESELEEARRARIVSGVARAIRESAAERARARRKRAFFTVLAAAAAIALLVGGLWGPLRGAPSGNGVATLSTASAGVLVTRDGKPLVTTANAEQPLLLGDSVSTVADARARFVLASGVEVDLGGGSRAWVSEVGRDGEVVKLDIGAVHVHAPPLGQRHFAVSTPNARVVVHGTRFSVEVDDDGSGDVETRVRVTEGKVGVEYEGHELFLTPGQSWSSRPTRAAVEKPVAGEPAAPAAPAVNATPPLPATGPHAAVPAKPAASGETTASALAAQNKLYATALAARDRGDDRASLGYLNQLLARYPSSPLAPEARVERFRALKRLGENDEAAREARRYLADQADGAAGDEARDVALSGSKK